MRELKSDNHRSSQLTGSGRCWTVKVGVELAKEAHEILAIKNGNKDYENQ
jgi:hypothetical protein